MVVSDSASERRKAVTAVLAQPFISIEEALDVARRSATSGNAGHFSSAVFRLFTDAHGIRDAAEPELAGLIAVVGSLMLAPVVSLETASSVMVDGWDAPFARAAAAARSPKVRGALHAAATACQILRRSLVSDGDNEPAFIIAASMLGRPDLPSVVRFHGPTALTREAPCLRSFDDVMDALERAVQVKEVGVLVGLAETIAEFDGPNSLTETHLATLVAASEALFDMGAWTGVLAIARCLSAAGKRNEIGQQTLSSLQRASVSERERWLGIVDMCGADLASLNLAGHDLRGLRASAAIPTAREVLFDPHARNFFREVVTYHTFTFEDFCEDYGLFLSDPRSEALYEQVLEEDPEWRSVDYFHEHIEQVVLNGATLNGADLRGAQLVFASAVSVNADSANFRDADLRYSDLRGANLNGADLRGANLAEADLAGAQLHGAQLEGAVCNGALVFHADLSGASLPADFWDVVHCTLPEPRRVNRNAYGPDVEPEIRVPSEFADVLEDGAVGAGPVDRADLAAAVGKNVMNAREAESAMDWTD